MAIRRIEAPITAEIPTPILAFTIAFLLGIFLGPPILALSKGGQTYLENQAKRVG